MTSLETLCLEKTEHLFHALALEVDRLPCIQAVSIRGTPDSLSLPKACTLHVGLLDYIIPSAQNIRMGVASHLRSVEIDRHERDQRAGAPKGA
jgi:hypothetical protein